MCNTTSVRAIHRIRSEAWNNTQYDVINAWGLNQHALQPSDRASAREQVVDQKRVWVLYSVVV